jgi:hypothetical protein
MSKLKRYPWRSSSTFGALSKPVLFAATFASALFVRPADIAAQEDEEDAIPVDESAPEGDQGGDEGAVEGAPEPGPGKGTAEAASAIDPNAPQVSETHSVQGGDTLWDLCSKYLNSPWYWPKIWSYNPQLTNPHWIYPGNELRFYPSDEGPTQIDASAQISVPESDDSSTVIEGQLDPGELVRATGQIGAAAPKSFFAAHIGFVSAKEHETSGEIVNAEAESYLLSDYDKR